MVRIVPQLGSGPRDRRLDARFIIAILHLLQWKKNAFMHTQRSYHSEDRFTRPGGSRQRTRNDQGSLDSIIYEVRKKERQRWPGIGIHKNLFICNRVGATDKRADGHDSPSEGMSLQLLPPICTYFPSEVATIVKQLFHVWNWLW